jgi:hypothetical protein
MLPVPPLLVFGELASVRKKSNGVPIEGLTVDHSLNKASAPHQKRTPAATLIGEKWHLRVDCFFKNGYDRG